MTVALPYKVPDETAVRAGAWLLRRGEAFAPVPPMLPDWDCTTDLTLRREVVVDRDAVADQTGLPADVELEVVVQWRVSDSLLSGVAFRRSLTEGSTGVDVEFTLPGRELGGTLTLSTSLLLRSDGPVTDGPIARHAGSVLWRDPVKRIRLAGEASRLPVTKVDFKAHGLDENAPWFVQIVGSPESPAMGAVQLLLNTRRDDVLELLESRTEHEVAARAVRSALYAAVGRALIEHAIALSDDELTDDAEYDDDALGAVLLAQLRLRFRGRTLSDLRALRENEPARFSALTDGRYGLLDGVLP
jgi:hypothetical protein